MAQDSNSSGSPRSAKSFSLPKTSRIKKRADFVKIQSSGSRFFSPHFVLSVTYSDKGAAKLGITVSKKIEKTAVGRNKLKRRIRELFRSISSNLPTGLNLVISAKKGATSCTYKEISTEILRTLRRHGLLH